MHEMSVALEICRITEARVGRDSLPRVREVGVIVGRQSGLEPDNLLFCLDALLGRPPFAGARTELEVVAGDELSVSYLEVDDGDPPH
ncbi:MAG: hydrogenase maturation nickel metallochaperone HypA [Gemmatimonadota bacterium]|nr:hydrogenase maturation nickel metallochaperone HypA [Gemmatimonadota bacterium]